MIYKLILSVTNMINLQDLPSEIPLALQHKIAVHKTIAVTLYICIFSEIVALFDSFIYQNEITNNCSLRLGCIQLSSNIIK